MQFSRRAKVTVILFAVLGVLATSSYLAWRQVSFNPLALRSPVWTLLTTRRFFAYCFVPIGATEADIRQRFGDPEYVLSVSASEYQEHIDMRRRTAGWTLPPKPFADRVLVYLDHEGLDQLEAYYFIDAKGRLAATFISET